MEQPAINSSNPIVQKILAGGAPAPVKLGAARGALPIPPEELLHVLYFLRADDDREIKQAVANTVRGFEDDVLAGLLQDPELPPAVLDFYARQLDQKPRASATVVGNKATSADTLLALAPWLEGEALELLVTNQVALIRTPGLLDALLDNSALSTDQRRRVEEVREEFFVKKELEEKRKRDEEARLTKIREKTAWSSAELEKLTEDLTRETQAEKEAGTLLPDPEDTLQSDAEEDHQSATQKIMNMSVPEKVLLAIRGSRSERAILIRDSNRMVATATIKSPKVSEAEVEGFAGLRNVNDEVLRIIGNRRDWLRNYPILLTLARNPRCPIPVAMNLLPRIQKRDLKSLQTDRNVSEVLRRQARSILIKLERGAGSR